VQGGRRRRFLMSCVILLQREMLKMTTVMRVSVSIQKKQRRAGDPGLQNVYRMQIRRFALPSALDSYRNLLVLISLRPQSTFTTQLMELSSFQPGLQIQGQRNRLGLENKP
jgi:hypothetical protein